MVPAVHMPTPAIPTSFTAQSYLRSRCGPPQYNQVTIVTTTAAALSVATMVAAAVLLMYSLNLCAFGFSCLCRRGWASLRRSRRGRGTRDCGKLILNFKMHNLSNIISNNNSFTSNNNRSSSNASYSNRRS